MERRHPTWAFKKELSLDTLVGIVGVAIVIGGPLVVAWRSAETRILTLEVTQAHMQGSLSRALDEGNRDRTAITTQIKEVADKMTSLQIDVAKIIATQALQSGRSAAK